MKCNGRLTHTRAWPTQEISPDLAKTIQVIAMTLVIYWGWKVFKKTNPPNISSKRPYVFVLLNIKSFLC